MGGRSAIRRNESAVSPLAAVVVVVVVVVVCLCEIRSPTQRGLSEKSFIPNETRAIQRVFIAVQREKIVAGRDWGRQGFAAPKTFARLKHFQRNPASSTRVNTVTRRRRPSSCTRRPSATPLQLTPSCEIQLDSIICIIDGVWSCFPLAISACFFMRFVDHLLSHTERGDDTDDGQFFYDRMPRLRPS